MMSRSSFLLSLALILVFSVATTNSFVPSQQLKVGLSSRSLHVATQEKEQQLLGPLFAGDNGQDEKLAKLGFSEDEIRRSRMEEIKKEEVNVNVNIVDDVDPFTLTALGFGLIALNFFVFANAGDGGISGLVATIINTARQ